jgi:hypothetical protein
MSYDLYFVGNASPSRDAFFEYFRDRPDYVLEGGSIPMEMSIPPVAAMPKVKTNNNATTPR